MSDTLGQWHDEHVNFAKLLDLLDVQLELFHQGKTPHYELMLDIMFYMTNYPDVLHHPREDLAFARIRARDQKAGPVVEELGRQHAQLRKMGEELVRSLGDIVNGSIASRASVEKAARAYVATFREHMTTEEKYILPLAAELLCEADWAAINDGVRDIEDPLFGRNANKRYTAIQRQIASQA